MQLKRMWQLKLKPLIRQGQSCPCAATATLSSCLAGAGVVPEASFEVWDSYGELILTSILLRGIEEMSCYL